MLTNEEQRMLKTVAAFNDITEEQAKTAIVKRFLSDMVADLAKMPRLNMKLPELPKDTAGPEIKPQEANELEKPKKRGGRPRKTVPQYVRETAKEVKQAERDGYMNCDDFSAYFSKKG